MLHLPKKPRGFTIVELLIVIVVIAILAAITIVAYNGIQNRANDTAVQSDLVAFAKKLQIEYSALGNPYPNGGGARASSGSSNTGSGTDFSGFTFSPSKGSYAAGLNLVYCTAPDDSGTSSFIVRAKSKSGTVYEFNSTVGHVAVYATSGNVPSDYTSCDAIGGWPRSWSYGMYNSNWQSWTT